MALKKVDKTGVYRHEDGSAVYLTEGAMVDERVLDSHKLDKAASDEFGKSPERSFYGGVQDAAQDQKAEDTFSDKRMVAGTPENRMEPPVKNRSDAELADDAAKAKKS